MSEQGFAWKREADELPAYSIICSRCARLKDIVNRKCEAFGDKEIPKEIWIGENDHKQPVDGDGGLLFKRVS